MSENKSLLEELEALRAQAERSLNELADEAGLAGWKSEYLGKASPVTQIFKRMGEAPPEERGRIGQAANQVKNALEGLYEEKAAVLKQSALGQALAGEKLDVTLPGRQPSRGRLHISTQSLREVYRIFAEMGFQVYRSPEVESEENNFELLNIPAHHPARDLWDTFFTKDEGVVLRTHTSPGQVRAMREFAPEPIRVVLPGMCYRYEQTDASHEFQFNQVELLAVGKGITFANLKGTLDEFARRMYGQDVRTRLRPSYFPFVEPGAEMDVECFVCSGKGCAVCKRRGWLEIMGCGMVHPVVLKNGGYDPAVYSGFAAGMGTERIAMLRHRITDIRNFWANDLRFLEQF
jgi:phenylalanyl-tRNA synthetase alpha chain